MHARSILSVLLIAFLATVPPAAWAEEEVGAAEQERLNPLLTVGGLTTEDYTEGIGDVVLPLYYNGQGLLFLNPRFSFTDRSAEEYNLGLGFRHLLADGRMIGGVNAFYDRRETGRNASFNQFGFGAEMLSHWVDMRANVYLPVDKEERVNEFTTVEESVSRTSRAATSVWWDDPYATGHDVLQDYEVLHTLRTRTTTTTTTRRFHEYEVALRGWDAEVGARLPVDPLEQYARLKAFAGYYQYYGRRGLDDVDGFRSRLEVHIKPAVVVDAVYYADDNLTGGNYSLGAYVSVPFDLANIAHGRNPFSGASERWEAGRQTDDLRYRLTDMVKRDPQIRSLIAEPEEQVEQTTTSSKTVSRSDTTKLGEGTAGVATDITFVDKDRGDDGNPGTFEEPKETVQGGVDEPREMVFVFREGNPYFETVTLTEGVVLRGEGRPIQAFGGKTFGSGVHPMIDATGLGASAVEMAANTSVSGFRIRNQFGDGIFSLTGANLEIRDNIIHDTIHGVHVEEPAGDVNVLLYGNRLYDNLFAGARIAGTGASGSYFVHARDNAAWNNTFGLMLFAANYDSALAVVDGLEAHDNTLFGLDAQLFTDFSSVLSLTDIRANDNAVGGVNANVVALDGVAAVVGGMPEVLMGLVNDLLGGMPLPPEAAAVFSASGPIMANNNRGDHGLRLNVDGRVAALLALLDVEASGNAVMGIGADVESTDGVALGFVGSSENLMEVLQLAAPVAGLFGLDMPAIPDSPVGPVRLNGNGVGGLDLLVNGNQLALGAVLGVQANGNTAFNGVNMTVGSPGVAIGLMGRIQADGNAVHGVSADVQGGPLGLAALLDIQARDNGVHGIDLLVGGDTAIGLVASTDPLRSLAAALNEGLALDPPLVVPGAPFGPVVASGNGISGINADIQGNSLAVGAFLDVVANQNEFFGVQAIIDSVNGDAFGVFGSSDMLFELVPPVLGEVLFGDPDAIPAQAYTPMGDMDLSGNNGGGLWANIAGHSGAAVLAGGITANDNLNVAPPPGNGLTFNLGSADGDVFAGLMNLTADGNAGNGIGVNAMAEDQMTIALLQSQASGNAGEGVFINGVSNVGDLFTILAGVNAMGNGLFGVDMGLQAAGDLGVAITSVNASDNLRHGLRLNGTAGGDAHVFANRWAVDDLRGRFGDFDLFGASDSLYSLMPRGVSVFNNNGWDPGNPGERAGMRLNLQAQDNVGVSVIGNTANDNSGNGFHLDLHADLGEVFAGVGANTASDNGLNGIRLDAMSADDSVDSWFVDNTADGNANAGLNLILAAPNGDAIVFGQYNRLRGNNAGLRVDATAGWMVTMDFGGGGLSAGENSIFGNTVRDVRNVGAGAMVARNNWWGVVPPAAGQFQGAVDFSNWLLADPNP